MKSGCQTCPDPCSRDGDVHAVHTTAGRTPRHMRNTGDPRAPADGAWIASMSVQAQTRRSSRRAACTCCSIPGSVSRRAIMQPARFQSELRDGHKGSAVQVPFDPRVRFAIPAQPLWPGRRGFPVHATLNGLAFDSAIVSRSRLFWLLVPVEISSGAGLAAGASCAVTVAAVGSATP